MTQDVEMKNSTVQFYPKQELARPSEVKMDDIWPRFALASRWVVHLASVVPLQEAGKRLLMNFL